MADDYCELCDLPRSQCIHGMPAPDPAPARAPARASRPRASRPKPAAAPVARARPRRWTPPETLRPHIVDVLREAGGELEQDEAFERLESRLSDSLLDADRERTPEGELRWRYAARRARQALIADGLMTKSRPGVWSLTSTGVNEG